MTIRKTIKKNNRKGGARKRRHTKKMKGGFIFGGGKNKSLTRLATKTLCQQTNNGSSLKNEPNATALINSVCVTQQEEESSGGLIGGAKNILGKLFTVPLTVFRMAGNLTGLLKDENNIVQQPLMVNNTVQQPLMVNNTVREAPAANNTVQQIGGRKKKSTRKR